MILADGTRLPADVVVLSVGVRPDTAAFGAAGITLERGAIVVDGAGDGRRAGQARELLRESLRLRQEVEKLAAYHGYTGKILKEDIEELEEFEHLEHEEALKK